MQAMAQMQAVRLWLFDKQSNEKTVNVALRTTTTTQIKIHMHSVTYIA